MFALKIVHCSIELDKTANFRFELVTHLFLKNQNNDSKLFFNLKNTVTYFHYFFWHETYKHTINENTKIMHFIKCFQLN
jgi:hypothetical protein